jgi:glycerophosphoryl diester phosphodiesterase
MSGIVSIAHRGASGVGHAPENTLAAFQQAIDIGVDIVECDVHCTSDEHVVI